MAETQLIDIDTKAFKAVVPWTRVMTGGTMLAIAAVNDSATRALVLMSVFRDVLAEDKRAEFDGLDIYEMIEACSQWLDKSNALVEAEQKKPEPEQPKRQFWSRRK